MQKPYPKLTDVFGPNGQGELADLWDRTEAAGDPSPLPSGNYVAHVAGGGLSQSRSGTPSYKLTFRVAEGDHAGRRLWHDLWLTSAAMPMAKRDLAKVGITSREQLEGPPPDGIRCRVRVALRRTDDGAEFNKVVSFDVMGVDPPEENPFAPDAGAGDKDAF
jgi:hypothetical protein